MAIILTRTAMVLLLCLAMSVGTWAAKSWTEWKQTGLGVARNTVDGDEAQAEEELVAFLNVLQGAEVALEADKFQTALAMVAGVIARLEATNLPDHEEAAEFQKLLPAFEDAVERDNKVKAIALINTLQAEFEQKEGGGVQKRALGESQLELDEKQKQHFGETLRVVFQALKEHQKQQAEEGLQKVYQLLKNDKEASQHKNGIAFMEAIHQAEKFVQEDQMDKAGQILQMAMVVIGIEEMDNISKGEAESKKEEDEAAAAKKMKVVRDDLKLSIDAIKENHKEKAEDILHDIYMVLKNDRISKENPAAQKFLRKIKQSEKLVSEGAMDKALTFVEEAVTEAAGDNAQGIGKQEEEETGKQEQAGTPGTRNRKTGTHGLEL